jgi:transglutaminase-like putative cysteine protease
VSSEGRARVGLSILLLVTLFCFAQVFAEGDYPGPTLLGMIAASGLAVAARRLGIGTGTTVVVSAAALFVYLVLIFQARNSFFLLPSPDAIVGLGRSIGDALRHSEVDFAPVPVRTGYVVLVVIGMWTATTIAEIATFRWRRPLLAALPCIALFCIQVTVGTGTGAAFLVVAFLLALLTYWGLESAHRVRSWGRWVPAFEGREGREPESVTGALARRMGAGCVAAALVAPFVVPALGDGLLAWRNEIGEGGFGSGRGSGNINPLVSIVPNLVNQSTDVLFRVRAERSEYWRLFSLADFDGRDWNAVAGAGEEPVADAVSFERGSNSPRADTEPLEQTFTFETLESDALPAAINPFEVDLPDEQSLSYDEENQDLTLADAAREGFTYTVQSNVPRLTYQELLEAEPGRLDPVYTGIAGASERVQRRAAELATDPETGEPLPPGEFLVRLQDYLRRFRYELVPEAIDIAEEGASVDYLEQFLFETKRGYCQQFATAFALLARSQGIPTRVTVGFLPGDRDPQTDEFVVTGVNTHAWPEVYFDDHGWVRFDPTPRLEAPEPRYTRPPLGPLGRGPGAGGPGGIGAALELQGNVTDRRLAGAASGAAIVGEGRAGEIGRGRVPENPAWAQAFNRVALAIAVLGILFLALVPSLKRWRIERRYRRARGPDGEAAAAFRHFEDEAAELAAPRGPAESAVAFAARLAGLRKVPSADAERLARIYEAAEYAPQGVAAGQARQAKVLARKLRGAMWARASWWTRAGRLFSPRGLVGRS